MKSSLPIGFSQIASAPASASKKYFCDILNLVSKVPMEYRIGSSHGWVTLQICARLKERRATARTRAMMKLFLIETFYNKLLQFQVSESKMPSRNAQGDTHDTTAGTTSIRSYADSGVLL